MRSSSSIGFVRFLRSRQKTIPSPPMIMAPPTPTTTPIMVSRFDVEMPELFVPVSPDCVSDTAVGVTIDVLVDVCVDATPLIVNTSVTTVRDVVGVALIEVVGVVVCPFLSVVGVAVVSADDVGAAVVPIGDAAGVEVGVSAVVGLEVSDVKSLGLASADVGCGVEVGESLVGESLLVGVSLVADGVLVSVGSGVVGSALLAAGGVLVELSRLSSIGGISSWFSMSSLMTAAAMVLLAKRHSISTAISEMRGAMELRDLAMAYEDEKEEEDG